MQTGKPETVTYVPVAFSAEEFDLLVEKVGVGDGPALAEFIHNVIIRSLRRKARKTKGDVPSC